MAQGAQLVSDRARTWPWSHLCLPIWFRQILERRHGFTWCCLASPPKVVITLLSPIPCTEWDPPIQGSDWACFSVVWSQVSIAKQYKSFQNPAQDFIGHSMWLCVNRCFMFRGGGLALLFSLLTWVTPSQWVSPLLGPQRHPLCSPGAAFLGVGLAAQSCLFPLDRKKLKAFWRRW